MERQEQNQTLIFSIKKKCTPRVLALMLLGARKLYTTYWLDSFDDKNGLDNYLKTNSAAYEESSGLTIRRGHSYYLNTDFVPATTEIELSVPSSHDPNILKNVAQRLESLFK